jgi:formylglycine-generating enzyme required for sulfatase activity
MPTEGIIAWEIHGGNTPREVEFKDLTLLDLRQPPQNDGFRSLFNGKDLAAWTPMKSSGTNDELHQPGRGGWLVRGGELICGTDENGWLRSNEQFSDFVLHLDYKLPPGGNSVVYLRSPGTGHLWETSLAITILDGPASRFRHLPPENRTGGIWGAVGPSAAAERPAGQWNHLEIRCQGDKVEVSLNGTRVVDADVRESAALRSRPRAGFIGLSNWHGQAKGTAFRNIRIQPLTTVSSTSASEPPPGTPTGSPEYLTTRVGSIKLKRIPGGEFLMGSPETDKDSRPEERPQHHVRISPFYLGVTEVTRGQFRLFVDQTGYRTEAEKDGKGGIGWNEESRGFVQHPRFTWRNPAFEQTDEHPVVNVSWNDAVEFCKWLSRVEGQTFRLPTEAEWEYACRAGTTTRFSGGDDPETLATVANVADAAARAKYPNWTWAIAGRDGYVYTAPVGRFHPNGFGLYDMHGNVWEWCSDGYMADYYEHSPVDDPPGPSGIAHRLIRGGSFSRDPRDARSAYRLSPHRLTVFRSMDLGFRVARGQSPR